MNGITYGPVKSRSHIGDCNAFLLDARLSWFYKCSALASTHASNALQTGTVLGLLLAEIWFLAETLIEWNPLPRAPLRLGA